MPYLMLKTECVSDFKARNRTDTKTDIPLDVNVCDINTEIYTD